jgi:uncharacterized protein (TIGR02145 family)
VLFVRFSLHLQSERSERNFFEKRWNDTGVMVAFIRAFFEEISKLLSSKEIDGMHPMRFKANTLQTRTIMKSVFRSVLLIIVFLLHVSLAQAQSPTGNGANSFSAPAVALRLLSPNGGEVFVSGSDTVIVWDGIPAGQSVTVECSIDGGKTWDTVALSASGFRLFFRVPATTIQRDSCLVRLITRKQQAIMDCMVTIPAGSFRMGDITGKGSPDERPVHDVSFSRPFQMSCTEVTQAQWHAVMRTNPSAFVGDSLPVEQVSWYDAVEFCNRLSRQEGLDTCYTGIGASIDCDFTKNGYRLPTEAEWEYACRGGTTTDFYTGNMTNSGCTPLDPTLDKAGWYCGNENTKTRNVAQKQPNAYGLYDMHGNVWEWCWDWYGTYHATPATDPRGPATGLDHVRRGGSWSSDAIGCRSSFRLDRTYIWSKSFGFRVVRNYEGGSDSLCTQKWMRKNLDVATYRNGDTIPEVRDPTQWANLTTGAWCYYNNDPAMGAVYGKLYNWYAVNDARGLAPVGWHVASDSEWKILEMCLGMTQTQADAIGCWRGTDEGGKLKEDGTAHWLSPNTGADNSSKFAALPGGCRLSSGTVGTVGGYGAWWSSSECNSTYAWYRGLRYFEAGVFRDYDGKNGAFSVRCIRD